VFVGGSFRINRGLLVVSVLGLLIAWAVGCTQFGNFKPADIPDAETDGAPFAISPTDDISGVSSCGLSYLAGDERAAAIQEALNDPKVQNLKQELTSRGFTVESQYAFAFSMDGEKLVYLPAGETAGIVHNTYLGRGYAVGIVKEGNNTINLKPDRSVRHITGFDVTTRAKVFKSLRGTKQIKALEKNLKKQKQRIDWHRTVLITTTDGGHATIGLAIEATVGPKQAWFGYRVDAMMLKSRKVTVEKISAEACGSLANLEGIETAPETNKLNPQTEHFDPTASVEIINESQICVSSWSYNYKCFSTTPAFGITGVPTTPLVAFVNTSMQANVTIWNYSNTTMSGTATATAPFTVTPTHFTLAAGQPISLTITFNPTASGDFSGVNAVKLTSGTVNQYIQLKAWTLSVIPARLDYTTFVGSSQNQTFTVRNDGPGQIDTGTGAAGTANTATVSLSTTSPRTFAQGG